MNNDDNEGKWIGNALKNNPPPDALPTGWVIRFSRSQHGAFFYYHQETGESKWEKPISISQKRQKKSLSNNESIKLLLKSKSSNNTTKSIKHGIPSSDSSSGSKQTSSGGSTNKRARKSTTTTNNNDDDTIMSTTTTNDNNDNNTNNPKEVRVLHILKKHKGSRRPSSWRKAVITSSLDEARQELQELTEVLSEVLSNKEELRATFEELARTESDCSSAKRGGDLGFFGRKKMQPTFESASFALQVGELSSIIETSSGVHVIFRIG